MARRRRRRVEEHVNHERWLVSYADFITLLFAFFTTLYAISTVDQKKVGRLMYSMRTAFNVEFFASDKPPAANRPAPIVAGEGSGTAAATAPDEAERARQRYHVVATRLQELAGDPAVAGRLSVHVEARGVVVSLAEAAFFESGDAHVRAAAGDVLGLVSERLLDSGLDVIVEGHTDDRPVVPGSRYESNWQLSTARATAVLALLVDAHGLDPRRISAAGYGEHRPVAANATPDGRARNRRVDIVVGSPPTAVPPAQ